MTEQTPNTLAAWLYQRFAVIHGAPAWDTLTDDGERSYWEHHAAAVRRAVARGGFKTPTDEAKTPEHGKLWSLLDWSFWGAGMGDTFRAPLADTMLSAVPAETIAHAEAVMAEFIERRNIAKTGVTIYQEQRDELEQLRARVAELETERKHYVGAEPTIAEEMAELGRRLDAVHDLCDKAEQQAKRWEHPLPVPAWVEQVRKAADGNVMANTSRPALPWAHAMDDYDLHLFLDDLVSAALNRWQTDQDGPIPDRVTLAEIERACARWRTPGQGYRSDEPASQPPTRAYPPALPWAALMDTDDLAGFLRDLDAGMRDAARQAHFAGRPQAPAVLTALEHACATWRLIAETQHAHNTAPGPDAETEGR